MSKSLAVQLTNEHLNRIKNATVVEALTEFIWNALDADASVILVKYNRNSLGGIDTVSISDNGHGIDYETIETCFGRLGNSYKLQKKKSPEGRLYHGKMGQGRYKGFVLGNMIHWESRYKEEHSGELWSFSISGNSTQLKQFTISEKNRIEDNAHGTEVTISDLAEKCYQLDSPSTLEKISMRLAPYLFAYTGITIILDDLKIDPSKSVSNVSDIPVKVKTNGNEEIEAMVKIIEWESGNHKSLFLCNTKGLVYHEEKSFIKENNFSHCVYVMSQLIEELHLNNTLEVNEFDPKYTTLKKEVRKVVRDYYRKRLSDNAAETVQQLKKENIYPYQGNPNNIVEEAERQVFDICAVKVHQHLPEFNKNSKPSKKLTLNLLKQAMIQNPSSMRKILNEVLDLDMEQRDELAELLERTSLSAIINTTKIISDRIAFINGLEQILFDSNYEKRLKERSQLHKILLNEMWIFGDQYEYGFDDISLKNVLKKHLKLLEREELLKEIDMKSLNGLDDIPDLGLWRQYHFGKPGEYENLIIELKRPSCTISEKEINQVKKYAWAIEDEKYFDKEKTKWTLYLIATKLNKYAKKECEHNDREFGHIVKQENLNVYVKEWNQLIQEAKGRLQFAKDKLEYSIEDNSEGLNYLKKKYNELIPS